MRVLLDENLPHTLRRFFEDSIEAIKVSIYFAHPSGNRKIHYERWLHLVHTT